MTGVAIVTGAADGIGWATAQRLAQTGATLVLADLREPLVRQRAADLGAQHIGLVCDVTEEASVRALVQHVVQRLGRVDVLVNNAGIGDQAQATVTQRVDAFDRVLDVHVRGTFLASREAARIMLAQGRGAIVNVASIAALAGIPMRNAYSAAKAGIVAMTRAMACEWGAQGIRVNAVAPGYVRTALVEDLADQGVLDIAAIRARTPMQRMGGVAEIAEVIAFLASPAASYVTGAVVPVDGGWLAHGAAAPGPLAQTGDKP